MLDKILLVEDEESTANYIYHKLEQLECDVLAKASNSHDAIKLAKDLKPKLILLDIMLEDEVDGIETASKILSFLDVPVVYITGRSDEDTIKRLMKVEPNAFIIKPFDEKILRSAIDIAVYRHQVKKELIEVKELLPTTIDSIDDILISFDSDGYVKYIHSNKENDIPFMVSAERLFKHYSEVFSAEMIKSLDVSFDNLKKTQKVQEFNLECKKINSKKWFHAKASLRKNSDENIIGITLLIRDISQEKKLEKELIISREKLTEAQKVAQLGTCEFDLVNNKMSYNDIFAELLQIDDIQTIKTINDNRITEIIHPEDRRRYKEYFKEVFENKVERIILDFRIINKSKEILYLHLIGKVVYEKDKPLVMLMTLQDVSWQKQSQKMWKDLFTARKSAEIKQQFFANVSHQLRTPLTEIIGVTGLLNRTELAEAQKNYLKTLRNSSETLINMIGDILDVSKIEAGKMKLSPAAYNIRKDLDIILNAMQRIADEKSIRINKYIDDKIPEFLYVDGKRVNQVVFNLLSNALKFTWEGSVTINILVEYEQNMDFNIRIEVIDTGIGISVEDHEILFEAFQKANKKAKSSSVGSGLGLYICKNLVSLLQGDIGVESDFGEGGKFWFTFKAKEYKGSDIEQESGILQDEIPNELDLSILLVEDKEENQKVLSMMLESIGCRVKIASDGRQAIELYQETVVNAFGIFGNVEYDIIIMDMYMPLMDGIEAVRELNEKYNELPPIIGLSASEMADDIGELEMLGFDDYLTKPVSIESLAKKLYYWKNKSSDDHEKPGIISDEVFIHNIDNYPIVNENTIKNIINHLGNIISIEDLLNSFVEDMDNYYYKSINAFKHNDLKYVNQIITAIKGLSVTLGALQVHEITKRMEHFANENNYEKVKVLFSVLLDKYMIFKKHVENRFIEQ